MQSAHCSQMPTPWFMGSSMVSVCILAWTVVLQLACGSVRAQDGIIITEGDLQALQAIKQALQDPNGALRTWNLSLGACLGKWSGVKCAQGQVIVLQLAAKGLGGQLAEAVGQLIALRKLILHNNHIQGAIPSSLASLSNIRGIYLNYNHFWGSIPAGIANSPVLQSLDLSHNKLSGAIPLQLGASSKLSLLDFSFNNLSSVVQSASFGSFSSLAVLKLSNNMLSSQIPVLNLTSLTFLNLSYNRFNSTIPVASLSLPLLQWLDLSHNVLSGSLPPEIANLRHLLVMNVSDNHLSSGLPPEIDSISTLTSLDLSHNNFNGSLPASLAMLKNLTSFNCSFNQLTGAVPEFAHAFHASSFEGNPGLCGYNASVVCAFPSPPPSEVVESSPARMRGPPAAATRRRRMGTFLIIVIASVVAGVLVISMASALICIFCLRKPDPGAMPAASATKNAAAEKSSSQSSGGRDGGEVGGGKLVHFDSTFTFSADDLLCATAEVLGKSTYGTVYRATFEDSSQVAVKRLREGIVKSQRDFEVEVGVLGKVRHANLLALRAYYWGPKDEKLLIYDFMPGGSLAAFLHARGPETPLHWHTRLSIAAGAARGLAHLHEKERIVHGNLTASNILLDARMSHARLSDFGLSRLMTAAANSNVIATANALGYRAPELTKLRKASTKSDVYSYGVVLLELLTGKSPSDASATLPPGTTVEGQSEAAGMQLPEWVASVVKEEWTNEIFDLELMKGGAPSEDDLINTLQLAMNCVGPSPASRPSMEEVAHHLNEMLSRPDPQSKTNTTSSES